MSIEQALKAIELAEGNLQAATSTTVSENSRTS